MKTLYKRSRDLPSEAISDGIIVVDVENDFFFNLNPVASFVWQALEVPQAHSDLCMRVLEQFEGVSQDVVEADVTELLEDLQSHGLVSQAK